MRRTLSLTLAVPVILALTAPADRSVAPTDAGPLAEASVDTTTAAVPIPPGRPASDAVATSRPAQDAAAPATNATAAPDAEGTIEDRGQRPAEGASPAVGSEAPPRPGSDGPVEATFLIAQAPEAGAVAGSGPRWRYTVEVDPALGIDPETVAAEVRAALSDERSWARTRTLEQVDDPSRARIRVVLAAPDVVDELCGRAGLRTAGIYSCWNGRFAALNSWRWEVGADAFTDITTYRNYLVNHEFGHGLGYGHVDCPAPDAPAPVMMQQSKGVGACVPNGWPYP